MKAISLWQPWASLIPMGIKTIETRSWTTSYRGDLLICASKKDTREQEEYFYRVVKPIIREKYTYNDFPFGVAVAIVRLWDCQVMTEQLIEEQTQLELSVGNWKLGRIAWIFTNIRPINKPFEVRGKQGLFEVEM